MRICGFILALALPISIPGTPQVSASEERRPADRILAIVDDEPILASDVEQLVRLGLLPRGEAEDQRQYRRRILDQLIEQTLRYHEVDRFGFAEVPVDKVEEELARVRSGFASEDAFAQRLSELSITVDQLKQFLARQIMVLVYVDERLGARVFVGMEHIQDYYDNTLTPALREAGDPVPPIDDVRESIRAVLREERLDEELEKWTFELRQAADIEDYFESRYDSLPPIVYEERRED